MSKKNKTQNELADIARVLNERAHETAESNPDGYHSITVIIHPTGQALRVMREEDYLRFIGKVNRHVKVTEKRLVDMEQGLESLERQFS